MTVMSANASADEGMAPRAIGHHAVPMVDHIRDLRRRRVVPYLSIGHRLGAAADPEIVELLGADFFASNTWITAVEYESALLASERLAADAWGADRSFYLVDGSSSGNHAFLLATLSPGDEVVVSRDLHWSLLVALIVSGARPVYVTPRLHVEHDVGLGIAPEDVATALDRHPSAKLVAIVSPSFCGVASDLRGIATVAHTHGVPLYVDEAWGPHFHFHPALPASAMESGADASVASVHKILPAVSQGSILHARSARIDLERLTISLRMMQTTSPLLPIVATLDAARRQMALAGEQSLERVISLARWAKECIAAAGPYDVLSAEQLGLSANRLDVTKFVIDVHRLGLTGYDVERRLNEEFAFGVESSDARGIIANFNLGETEESATAFVDALAQIARERAGAHVVDLAERASGGVIALPEQAMTPREAFFAPVRKVRLAESAGEIAAELVTPYPPGIPILAPGEIITRERIDFLTSTYGRGAVAYGKQTWDSNRLIAVVDR